MPSTVTVASFSKPETVLSEVFKVTVLPLGTVTLTVLSSEILAATFPVTCPLPLTNIKESLTFETLTSLSDVVIVLLLSLTVVPLGTVTIGLPLLKSIVTSAVLSVFVYSTPEILAGNLTFNVSEDVIVTVESVLVDSIVVSLLFLLIAVLPLLGIVIVPLFSLPVPAFTVIAALAPSTLLVIVKSSTLIVSSLSNLTEPLVSLLLELVTSIVVLSLAASYSFSPIVTLSPLLGRVTVSLESPIVTVTLSDVLDVFFIVLPLLPVILELKSNLTDPLVIFTFPSLSTLKVVLSLSAA